MKSENCPEVRCEIAEKTRRAKGDNEVDPVERREKKSSPKLFSDSGRPFCLNMPKMDFRFHDEGDRYELDLKVHKWDQWRSCLLSNLTICIFGYFAGFSTHRWSTLMFNRIMFAWLWKEKSSRWAWTKKCALMTQRRSVPKRLGAYWLWCQRWARKIASRLPSSRAAKKKMSRCQNCKELWAFVTLSLMNLKFRPWYKFMWILLDCNKFISTENYGFLHF